MRDTLGELVRLLPVVVISGRAPQDLPGRIGLHKACYVGHHGLSCLQADGDVTWLVTPPRRTLVRRWLQALQTAAYGIEGAFVEDKGVTIELHDRLVKPKHRSRLRRHALLDGLRPPRCPLCGDGCWRCLMWRHSTGCTVLSVAHS